MAADYLCEWDDSVRSQARSLSSGTIATLMYDENLELSHGGGYSYTDVDRVWGLWWHWLDAHGSEYKIWQDAWRGFVAEKSLQERLDEVTA